MLNMQKERLARRYPTGFKLECVACLTLLLVTGSAVLLRDRHTPDTVARPSLISHPVLPGMTALWGIALIRRSRKATRYLADGPVNPFAAPASASPQRPLQTHEHASLTGQPSREDV